MRLVQKPAARPFSGEITRTQKLGRQGKEAMAAKKWVIGEDKAGSEVVFIYSENCLQLYKNEFETLEILDRLEKW